MAKIRNDTCYVLKVQCKKPGANNNWGALHTIQPGETKKVYSYWPLFERNADAVVYVEHKGRLKEVGRYHLFERTAKANVVSSEGVSQRGEGRCMNYRSPLDRKAWNISINDIVAGIEKDLAARRRRKQQAAQKEQTGKAYARRAAELAEQVFASHRERRDEETLELVDQAMAEYSRALKNFSAMYRLAITGPRERLYRRTQMEANRVIQVRREILASRLNTEGEECLAQGGLLMDHARELKELGRCDEALEQRSQALGCFKAAEVRMRKAVKIYPSKNFRDNLGLVLREQQHGRITLDIKKQMKKATASRRVALRLMSQSQALRVSMRRKKECLLEAVGHLQEACKLNNTEEHRQLLGEAEGGLSAVRDELRREAEKVRRLLSEAEASKEKASRLFEQQLYPDALAHYRRARGQYADSALQFARACVFLEEEEYRALGKISCEQRKETDRAIEQVSARLAAARRSLESQLVERPPAEQGRRVSDIFYQPGVQRPAALGASARAVV